MIAFYESRRAAKSSKEFQENQKNKDKRKYKFIVDGIVHNVGVFTGLTTALQQAKLYAEQIGKPVELLELN